MRKFFSHKGRYENCLYVLFSLVIIIFSISGFSSSNEVTGIWKVLYIIGLVYGAISLLYFIVTSFIKNKKELFERIHKILYLINIVLTSLILVKVLIIGTIECFILASQLPSRPTTDYSLGVRLAYICLNNYSSIINGVLTTLWLSLAGTIVGLILGLLFVSLRTLEVSPRDCEFVAFIKKCASGFVQIYVSVFRGTPMMVQAIIIYYFLPGILSGLLGVDQRIINDILSVSVAGFITVSLNTTAYLTEVLRGGVESLNKGQMEAARSLGMSRTKAMFYVVLPQGIKNSLPAICNEFIINIKDTSVLSVISVMDLFFVIDSINGRTANQDAIFIAAIIYLCLTFGISKILGRIEKRMNLVAKPLPSSN